MPPKRFQRFGGPYGPTGMRRTRLGYGFSRAAYGNTIYDNRTSAMRAASRARLRGYASRLVAAIRARAIRRRYTPRRLLYRSLGMR